MLIRLPLAVCLPVAFVASQTTASYVLDGQGCNGGLEGICYSQNATAPVLVGNSLPNEYAHAAINTSATAVTVIGFSLYTSTVAAAPGVIETVQTGVYRDATAGATTHSTPALVAEGNGTISVDGVPAWYRTNVYPPVVVQPGEAFWIAADTNAVLPPDNSAGAPGPAASYWRRPPFGGGNWSVTGLVSNPVFEIHCLGSTPIPTLTAAGTPILGTSLQVDVTETQATAPVAFFLLGFDDTQFSGFPTPVNLAVLGMPDCYAYSSSDDAFLVQLSSGTGSYTLNIPNDPALDGFPFVNQWAVLDAAAGNSLSILTSNAGNGILGM